MSTSTATLAVTDADFDQEVLQSDKPVLVDFWAVWCGPCRAVAPVVEEIAQTYGEQLKVVKLDTDANPRVTAKYGITSIPSLYVFSGGEVVKTIVGAKPKPVLVREIEPFLG
jgi:thioredoxin 1